MKYPLRPVFISICVLAMLLFATLSGCNERGDQITITTPGWDSLTLPLKMRTYYVTVSSRQETANLSLRIDVYKDGKAVQRSGGVIIHYQELKPIEINNAIYFDNRDNDPHAQWGTIVSAFGKNKGDVNTAPFKLDIAKREFASLNHYKFNEPINPNGITPLFAVVYGATSFIGGGDLKKILSYHKDVPVIVFSLEASQEIREFKPAPGQQLPTFADDQPEATILLQSE